MAKKKTRHVARRTHHTKVKPSQDTMVVVQGWMFVVAFALMLGIGAIVGTYFNRVINGGQPMVAGTQVEYR
jgi:hypothetical protein